MSSEKRRKHKTISRKGKRSPRSKKRMKTRKQRIRREKLRTRRPRLMNLSGTCNKKKRKADPRPSRPPRMPDRKPR